MHLGRLVIVLSAALAVCAGAAEAQGLRAPCQATAAAAPPPAFGAIDVAIRLPPAPAFAMTSCRFDLRSLASVRRPARAEPMVATSPFDFDKEYLSRSPGHGTVESFDTIVSYTPEPGFAGVDTFTIDLAGAKAGPLGPTRVNFVVSRDGASAAPGFPLR